MDNNQETRVKKFKKYRESIYGGSFFYKSFLNFNVNTKKYLEVIEKYIQNFDHKKIIEKIEINAVDPSYKNLDLISHLNLSELYKIEKEIEKFDQELINDFSFLEKNDLSLHIFDQEIENISKISINNKEKNEKN
ncbi:hypothetical protein [Mesomycoplasma lagogenitalium]|uniref:Uncharacterized protein n=1 Tax=Mesomycoplasma lagogenitalium TaxID=171286 RepID=A0ABY8LT73_9BACT|nr:hypothetical protein [Mesomycoplasma lagogenitalium]WGI36445.1 hypothetical protein QEG99_03185 [Mesomycoplasma lagogenitalium]